MHDGDEHNEDAHDGVAHDGVAHDGVAQGTGEPEVVGAAAGGGSPSVPFTLRPAKRRSPAKIAGALLGVIGIAGGAAFAYTQVTGGEKANTPEQAVQTFLTSLETGDVIGMAKLMAPGERDVMLDSMVPMMNELSRLDILDKNLDLAKVPGIEAKLSNFKATSKLLRPDLAEVTVTGGRLSTRIDPKKLPIGPFLRDLIGDDIDKAKVETSDDALADGNSDSPLVVQKIGKRWYISLNYSVAEAARRDSSTPFAVPAKGAGVPAKGAATAEEAVSSMITAMGHLDVRRMIELLPPDEFAALHDYAGQFIDDAESGVAEAKKIVTLDITPKLASTKIGSDRAMVTIVDLPTKLHAENDGTVIDASYANKALKGSVVTGDGEKISADFTGKCLTLVVDDETKKGCGQKGIADLFSEISGQTIDDTVFEGSGIGVGQTCLTKKSVKPNVGIVAVKRDGLWYVSPMRTWLDDMTGLMKIIERKDLDCIKKQIEDSVNSLSGIASSTASSSTFEAPLDPASDPFASDTLPSFDASSDTLPADTGFDTVAADTVPGGPTFDSTPARDTAVPAAANVVPGLEKEPVVRVPAGSPPATLQVKDLVVGNGPTITAGSTVKVQYVGVAWSTGKTFDSTWSRDATPFDLVDVGNAPVIPGWNKGLIGAREGGRRQLIIPAADAYGDTGAGDLIKPGETLIFVIDIVRVDD